MASRSMASTWTEQAHVKCSDCVFQVMKSSLPSMGCTEGTECQATVKRSLCSCQTDSITCWTSSATLAPRPMQSS